MKVGERLGVEVNGNRGGDMCRRALDGSYCCRHSRTQLRHCG